MEPKLKVELLKRLEEFGGKGWWLGGSTSPSGATIPLLLSREGIAEEVAEGNEEEVRYRPWEVGEEQLREEVFGLLDELVAYVTSVDAQAREEALSSYPEVDVCLSEKPSFGVAVDGGSFGGGS